MTGVFPEADKDPVIQIANMVLKQGASDPFVRNVFTLNTCAAVVGSQVLSFPSESQLLKVRLQAVFMLYQTLAPSQKQMTVVIPNIFAINSQTG